VAKMDINVNMLQSQPAAVTPLTTDKIKQPVESLVKTAADATRRTDAKSVNDEKVTQAVTKLNDFVQNIQRNLQFSVDHESGVMVVKVIEANTEKVIRQIPNEETLRLARNLVEQNDEAGFNIFSSKA
jgi:flagellar protein FlaG